MHWRLAIVLTAACSASFAQGLNWSLFGSAGTEAQVSPENRRSPINPGGLLNIPNLADNTDITLFGKVAPEDNSWSFHFKLRGEGAYSRESFNRFDIDEAYMTKSITPWLGVEAGRKIEKWGTGYAWNPTGVVNPPKDPRDPNDRRSAFRGVDLFGVDLQAFGWAVTLLGVPELNWNGQPGRFVQRAGWAARAYRLVKGTDIAITASGGAGLARSSGLSLSRVFGNALEVHAEGAYFERAAPQFGVTPRRHYSEVVGGGQYTLPHNVNVVAEYLYRGDGLTGAQWAGYQRQVADARDQAAAGNPGPLFTAAGEFAPLLMGRNYAFLQVSWPIMLNKLTVQALILRSLRDASAVVQPGIFWRVSPAWTIYLLDSEFTGAPHTEVSYVPVRRTAQLGIRYAFSFKKGS